MQTLSVYWQQCLDNLSPLVMLSICRQQQSLQNWSVCVTLSTQTTTPTELVCFCDTARKDRCQESWSAFVMQTICRHQQCRQNWSVCVMQTICRQQQCLHNWSVSVLTVTNTVSAGNSVYRTGLQCADNWSACVMLSICRQQQCVCICLSWQYLILLIQRAVSKQLIYVILSTCRQQCLQNWFVCVILSRQQILQSWSACVQTTVS